MTGTAMFNLFTDAALKKRVRAIGKVDRDDLWKELHDIGVCFALFGATSEALSIWEYTYSGIVPLPDPDDRTVSVHGDGAISSVCYYLKLRDVSRGRPAPKYVDRSAKLADRVQQLEQWLRPHLTCDAWSSSADWEDPSPDLLPTALYRKARLLAFPPRPGSHASTEVEALALLQQVLAMPSDKLIPYHRAQALLLAADISVRYGRIDGARSMLEQWYDFIVQTGTLPISEPFVLPSLTRLLCDGVLSRKSKLTENARKKLVQTVVSQLKKRLSRPEPIRPTPRKYTIYVSYGQFYLEPLKPNLAVTHFQEVGEPEQGFSVFPGQVAIGTPADADQCTVEAEIKSRMPALGNAVQAVVVPLAVTDPQGLFLRTVDYHGKKNRFDIPIGDYDVVARFFLHRPKKNENSCLSSWRVKLTFLPGGTIGAKCLRLESGAIPSRLIQHGDTT